MNDSTDWPHRWFGVWAEYGERYRRCPSVHQFVRPYETSSYPASELRRYLTTAPIVASTSRQSFPDAFTGERRPGSISFRTDGYWLWLDDLPDYIENHGVAIPPTWFADIASHSFQPPTSVDDGAITSLDWPPVD